jgi:hypothetical protein
MANHQLTNIGGNSAGVILPKEELKEENLIDVDGEGSITETKECRLRVQRFDVGAWQVLRTDLHDYPAFFEKRAYQQPPQPTA